MKLYHKRVIYERLVYIFSIKLWSLQKYLITTGGYEYIFYCTSILYVYYRYILGLRVHYIV